MTNISSVVVVGLGYIGLPTAAILATNGLHVTGIDVNERIVEAVNRGEVPFVEPDLAVHVAGAVSQGLLAASSVTPAADAYIVAVPTPFNQDLSADLSYIEAAARGIAPKLGGGELIILESTSPPGATQHLADYITGLRPDLNLDGAAGASQIHVAHCPERVLPGRVMIELVTNDRIVGGLTPLAAQMAAGLYETFCQGEIHVTDAVTAEMAKLVENSYRDVNIAFANELSIISDKLNIDVWKLIELANHHPRVNILEPGPGVGGHCIAVDPWFVVAAAPEESQLIRTAREVNDSKPQRVVEQVLRTVQSTNARNIAVLGLSFKANIDDLRQSPALDIVRKLAKELPNVLIQVVEPHIDRLPTVLGSANVCLVELDDAIRECSVLVALVDHHQFDALAESDMKHMSVIDTRGMFRSQRVSAP